jgi:hypothetical protein
MIGINTSCCKNRNEDLLVRDMMLINKEYKKIIKKNFFTGVNTVGSDFLVVEIFLLRLIT